MTQTMSLEQELLVLRELTEMMADRLDVLSERIDPPKRQTLRILRAQALGLSDTLQEMTTVSRRAPTSPKA